MHPIQINHGSSVAEVYLYGGVASRKIHFRDDIPPIILTMIAVFVEILPIWGISLFTMCVLKRQTGDCYITECKPFRTGLPTWDDEVYLCWGA